MFNGEQDQPNPCYYLILHFSERGGHKRNNQKSKYILINCDNGGKESYGKIVQRDLVWAGESR